MNITWNRFGGKQISAASGNVAAAAATATIAAIADRINFLTGFTITGAGATAASVIAVTVTGLKGGTLTYNMAIPAGATAEVTPLNVHFTRPLEASAANTAISVSAASFGAGNTNAAAVAHGFSVSAAT